MSFDKELRKRTVAIVLSAVMASGGILPSVPAVMAEENSTGDSSIIAKAVIPKDNYSIKKDKYSTRLRVNLDNVPEFDISFQEQWEGEDEERFVKSMGEALLKKGKIQINDGKTWSFQEAGLKFANANTSSSFMTTNIAFMKEFCEAESLNITVTTPEGYQVVAEGITNELTPEDCELLLKDDTSSSGQGTEKEPGTDIESGTDTGTSPLPRPEVPSEGNEYTIYPYGTYLRHPSGSDKVLRIDFNEFQNGSDPKKTQVLDEATISINNHDYGSMKSLGFVVTHWFGYELKDLTKIKEQIDQDKLTITVKTSTGATTFTIINELSEAERQEITGNESKPEVPSVSSDVKIGDCRAQLVTAKDPNTPSMSGPTLEEKAQIITDAKGNSTLVLHFKTAEIMGIQAWSTNLELNGLKPEFLLRGDNTAVCLVPITSFNEKEKVFQGHIYSNVMDADVALKVTKPQITSDFADALQKQIIDVGNKLQNDNFYEETKTPVIEALNAAKNNPKDIVKAYNDLLKAEAGLREILADPFVGNILYHVKAKDASVLFKDSVAEYARVEEKDGKKILTVHYNSILTFEALVYAKDIKVFNQNGNEIPAKYELDENKNGTLTFEMKEIPPAGNFKVKITDGKGKIIESELQLDYATIVKGPFKQLLIDAVNEYGYYTDDNRQRVEMSKRKDSYTDTSWKYFEEVLKRCDEHLHVAVMQDVIDEDVAELKAARNNLVYKIKAGHGNTANTGIDAINQPARPYYPSDGNEHSELVGWAGSKVVFGKNNGVYRVLDNGQGPNGNGKMLLMAENVRVKHPFAEGEEAEEVRWKNSLLRKELNGEFYEKNYSPVEKTAIVETKVATCDYMDPGYGTPARNSVTEKITNDYIFAPSGEMVENENYGYGSRDSRIAAFPYTLRNVFTSDWGADTGLLNVKSTGSIDGRASLTSEDNETLPCLNIDASKILMTIDAKTGLSEKMTDVKPLESNLWKLVLKDESISLGDNLKGKVKGNQITLNLGEFKGEAMAVVVEGNDFKTGKIKSYGKVNDDQITLNSFDADKEKIYVMGIRDGEGAIAASVPVAVAVDGKIDSQIPQKPEENDHNQSDVSIGTIDMKMLHETRDQASMCNAMFDTKANVEVIGNEAVIKILVANPVPNFKDQGKDGTVKNMSVLYKGKTYKVEYDLTSKPMMTAKENNSLFGLKKGEKYPAQVLTVKLPKEALQEKIIPVKAYVNVVMLSDVDFRIEMSNLKLDAAKPEIEDGQKEKVKEVIDLIAKIGKVTIKDGDFIKEARNAYESLDVANQKLVTNIAALEDAEIVYKVIVQEENEKEAAKVDALIKSIGKVTKKSGEAIKIARTAYNKLDDAQKAEVKQLQTLMEAEKAFEKFKDDEAIKVYEVPVKMVKANKIGELSMGNQAIESKAKVSIGEKETTYEMNFKGIKISGLYGHLLKLWHYEEGIDGTPIEAVASNPYEDINLTGGKSSFYKTFTITRDSDREDSFYVKISVDAMEGFDQDANLIFDWDKAEKLESDEENIENPNANFKDVLEDAWYKDAVNYVVAKNIMVGTSEEFFSPELSTNRAMIVTMLYRLEGEPNIVTKQVYSDVNRGEWYAKAVSWASKNDIVSGYGDGKFGPTNTVTREQLATILYRYADYKGYKLDVHGNLAQFSDKGNINDWAYQAMDWAHAYGLINGTGQGIITPQGIATRAQVASIFMRFCENFSK